MWALIQYELYPYRKRRLRHRYTQGKSSEDNRRRWPSPNQGEASEQKWSCQHLQFSSVQKLSCVQLFATPWATACQATLSITNYRSWLKLMSIKLMMPSNHLILCLPLLLLPSIFPSIRVFSNESVLHIRWPKYWSLSFSISPSSEYSGLISFRMDWFDLLTVDAWEQVRGAVRHWLLES